MVAAHDHRANRFFSRELVDTPKSQSFHFVFDHLALSPHFHKSHVSCSAKQRTCRAKDVFPVPRLRTGTHPGKRRRHGAVFLLEGEASAQSAVGLPMRTSIHWWRHSSLDHDSCSRIIINATGNSLCGGNQPGRSHTACQPAFKPKKWLDRRTIGYLRPLDQARRCERSERSMHANGQGLRFLPWVRGVASKRRCTVVSSVLAGVVGRKETIERRGLFEGATVGRDARPRFVQQIPEGPCCTNRRCTRSLSACRTMRACVVCACFARIWCRDLCLLTTTQLIFSE